MGRGECGGWDRDQFLTRMLAWSMEPMKWAGHSNEVNVNFTIETDREVDGRWIAEVTELPGALVYGATEKEAVASPHSHRRPHRRHFDPAHAAAVELHRCHLSHHRGAGRPQRHPSLHSLVRAQSPATGMKACVPLPARGH